MTNKGRCLLLTCVFAVTGFSEGAETARADEPSLDKVEVFVSGTEGYHSYRIPSIVTALDGSLLVFCEGRKTSRSDDGDIDMLLRRHILGGGEVFGQLFARSTRSRNGPGIYQLAVRQQLEGEDIHLFLGLTPFADHVTEVVVGERRLDAIARVIGEGQ